MQPRARVTTPAHCTLPNSQGGNTTPHTLWGVPGASRSHPSHPGELRRADSRGDLFLANKFCFVPAQQLGVNWSAHSARPSVKHQAEPNPARSGTQKLFPSIQGSLRQSL